MSIGQLFKSFTVFQFKFYENESQTWSDGLIKVKDWPLSFQPGTCGTTIPPVEHPLPQVVDHWGEHWRKLMYKTIEGKLAS